MEENIVKTVTVTHKGHTDGRVKRKYEPMEAVSPGKAIRVYEAMQELQATNPIKAAEIFMQYRRMYWIHPVTGTYRRLFHHRNRKMNNNMNALDALRKKDHGKDKP